jgi:hypothetical protein
MRRRQRLAETIPSCLLVVGHDNTIPDLVKALGIATPVNIPENDYSELIAIILSDKPQLLRLHYPN